MVWRGTNMVFGEIMFELYLFSTFSSNFSGTIYGSKQKTKMILLSLCFVGPIIMCIAVLGVMGPSMCFGMGMGMGMGMFGSNTQFMIVWLGGMVIDLITSMTIIVLFNRKLFLLMLSRISEMNKQNTSDIIFLNQQQMQLISTATKYTLLSTISLCSTLVIFIIWISAFTFMMESSFYYIIPDAFINSLCVYLLFKLNDDKYDKLCRLCHFFCESLCTKCGEHNVKRASSMEFSK